MHLCLSMVLSMGLFGLLSCRLAPSSSWMCPLMSGCSDASLFAPAGSPHSRLDTRHGLLHPLGWAYPVSGRPEPFHRTGILSARKAGIGVFRIAPLGSCEMVTTFRMGPHGSVLGCLPTRVLYPGARRPTVAGYKPGYFTMRPMVHDMTNRTAHPPIIAVRIRRHRSTFPTGIPARAVPIQSENRTESMCWLECGTGYRFHVTSSYVARLCPVRPYKGTPSGSRDDSNRP